MQFFDREREMAALRQAARQAEHSATLTMITGRRRIGKTSLVLRAYKGTPFLYFFVSRKAESELCADFTAEITRALGIPVMAPPARFADVFAFLMQLSEQRSFTLMIDEFQDFVRVNKSIFSDMQRIWDLGKDSSHMNLVVCGSVHSLMNRIFKDQKEPLYGRQTAALKVQPFAPSVLKDVLRTYRPDYTPEDLLSLYLYTGGVAKYVELLMDSGNTTANQMLGMMTAPDSPFIEEGKTALIEEFGKDYGMYFSILSLIARGYTTRAAMQQMLHTEIGGYLTKLKDEYGLLSTHRPLFAKPSTKNLRYAIDDNFLRFWFRFIYKYNYMIEIGANDKLRALIARDYPTYSGKILERYFEQKLAETGRYTRLGHWYDRRGENEIDLIAADELAGKVTFFEVKRQAKEIHLDVLRRRADVFLTATGQFADYEKAYEGLCMDNM